MDDQYLKRIEVTDSTTLFQNIDAIFMGKTGSEDLFIYKTLVQKLMDIDLNTFFDQVWEKLPCHVYRKQLKSVDLNIFSKDIFLECIASNKIPYHQNMNIVKFISGKRKSKQIDYNTIANPQELSLSFQQGYTVQFFQPQRFNDILYNINAGFEYIFGTLAGASVYMTPPGTQGLAPHFDDVEVFIIQTEGQKEWHIWPPSMPLADYYSADIPKGDPFISTPPTVFILSPGDILYMPRGTIHEAVALDTFSTHVTVSVYQHYNMKTLLSHLIPKVLDVAFKQDMSFRHGLPRRMSSVLGSYVGTSSTMSGDVSLASNIATTATEQRALIREHRTDILTKTSQLLSSLQKHISEELIDLAADDIVRDFSQHRLPPPDLAVSHKKHRKRTRLEYRQQGPLSASSIVRISDSNSFQITVQEVEGVRMLMLHHSRFNKREVHMGHPSLSSSSSSSSSQLSVEGVEGDKGDEEDGHDEVPLLLPFRFAPVCRVLIESYTDTSTVTGDVAAGSSVSDLLGRLRKSRFRLDEVLECLELLREGGFLDVVRNNTSDGVHLDRNMKDKKRRLPLRSKSKNIE